VGEEFVFIEKSIVHGESSKGMGYLEDRSVALSKAGIMFKIEFQAPFRHSRMIF